MKTSIKVTAIILMALVLNSKAQVKVKYQKDNNPKTGTYVPRGQNSNSSVGGNNNSNTPNQQNNASSQNSHGYWPHGNGGGNITIAYSNYPQNGCGYGAPTYVYNSNPNYGYSAKKAARYSLNASKAIINQSIDFNNWNAIYSPLLAKAIRHHNFAKQLYWWGNYDAAIHHAERARYLAWHSLQYFQNPNYYDGGYEGGYNHDPSGDPNNPYYKSGNSANKTQEDSGVNGSKKQALPDANEIDKKLPDEGVGDKELIKSFDQSKDE